MYFKAILTLLVTATFVLAPLVSSPFSGFSADQLPLPQDDPPVQPAGYAFSIWGLIYAWLVVSAIFGLWKRPRDAGWDAARGPLILSLALGTPWLAVANASAIWATVLIFPMMAAAVAALLVAPTHDRWWLLAPLGLYAGWLTAAAFVSLGSTAAGYGVLMGPLGWAFACIAAALVLAWAAQRRVPYAPAYGVAVIWALVGIVVNNGTDKPGVALFAAAGAAIIVVLLLSEKRRIVAT